MTVRTGPPAPARSRSRTTRDRVPTNLSLPADLVAAIDAVAGPRNRSAFVEDAVRTAIKRERWRIAWEESAGAWKGKGPQLWDEPGGVATWVRELRSEVTVPGEEQ